MQKLNIATSMATFPYAEILLGFVCFFLFYHWIRNRNSIIINWPVLGMMPGLLWNLSRVHDLVTDLLKHGGGTFEFKGPWYCDLDFILTSDPLNTHHILSKSFPNYPKGEEFGVIFEPCFGEGILAADSDLWKFQRKMTHSYLKDAKFQLFLEKTIQEKVANSLIPLLDHVCVKKMEVNMEDVFQRLGFDIVCLLFLGCDAKCLSVDFPQVPYEKAFNDVEEAMLYRHVVPGKYWKLLKWLQIGEEKKLTTAAKIFDDFIYQCITSKREKYLQTKTKTKTEESPHKVADYDFLTAYLMEEEAITQGDAGDLVKSNPRFLRDAASNLVAAGRDTSSAALSWFFWLVATHQSVETKILEEIKENIPRKDGKQIHLFGTEDVNKLVYLHAALCETLRLCPSVPFNHKCSLLPDTLPSGLRVKANTKIFMSFYAMGRMEGIWGKDCCEFKPERWISKDGGIVHVPSYKFTAFNAGPRSCLGKDMSLIQMKIIAVAIILNYRIRIVDDHLVLPSCSIVLSMRNGLKVRVSKRSV